jgi:hypothetical protein
MPPEKRPGKGLPVEGPSHAAGGQVLKTTQTTHLQTSAEPRPIAAKARRSQELLEQPATQEEVLAKNTTATTATSKDQNSRGPAARFGRRDPSNHRRWTGTPPLGEWALMTHAGTTGQKESDGEKSPGHAAIDRTRKTNSGKVATSNRTPSPVGRWALTARAFAIATSTTVTSLAK